MPGQRHSVRRILMLAPPLRSYGGVQTYTLELFHALESLLGSHAVRLLSIADEAELAGEGKRALRRGVKFRFFARAVATAVGWRPDLVICLHVGTARLARTIRQFLGTPYWLVLHGVEAWCALPAPKHKAILAADRYIALSRFTFESTVRLQGIPDSASLVLLPPYLCPNLLGPTGETAADSQDPVVLTVSRLAARDRYKGHDVVLQAWAKVLERVPNAQYWIVGEGDDRAHLEALARELGISTSVRFMGALEPSELRAAYERSSVFAMPSRTDVNPAAPQGEGFGIAFVEALAHGRPVVGPRDGAPAEYLRSGEFGELVDPTNPNEVAGALIALLQNPERARAMGQAGRAWVSQELSYERFCARLRQAMDSEAERTPLAPQRGF